MPGLLSLLVAVLAYVGPMSITVVPEGAVIAYDEAHRTAENPDGAYSAVAKARCPDGVPTLVMTPAAMLNQMAVVHEFLHAADCAGDGVFNGSLDPTGCAEVPTDCAHSWVYWAMRNQEAAVGLLDRMPRP